MTASILAWMDVKPAARRDEAFERLLPDAEGIEEGGIDPSASVATTPIEDFKAYCASPGRCDILGASIDALSLRLLFCAGGSNLDPI